MKRILYLLLLATAPAFHACNTTTPAPKTEQAHELPPICAKLNGQWWQGTSAEGSYARNLLTISGTSTDGTVVVIEVYNNTGELAGEYPFSETGSTQLRLVKGGKEYTATSGKISIEKAAWNGEESVAVSGKFSAQVVRPGEKIAVTEGSFREIVCPVQQ